MNRRGLWVVLTLFFGLFFVLFGLLAVSAAPASKSYRADNGQGIGVLEIIGEIGDSKEALKQIRGFAEEASIKAVLVRIDSPGGAVAPSQEIYSELKRLNEKKPVVASFGSLAASGGYYIALGAKKIISNPGTMTGSIGVIMETMDASKLVPLTRLEFNTYKSGELKDMGTPLREASANDKKVFADMIQNVYGQFVKAVAESRGIKEEDVRKIADGRVMTGEQALEHKLVDQLGSFQVAVDVAADLGGIKGTPDLVYPPSDSDTWFLRMVKDASRTAAREVSSELSREMRAMLRSTGGMR